MTATTEPTLLEELHALEVTAHRLATERDNALAERADLIEANYLLQQELDFTRKAASQATKDLVQARHELIVSDTRNAALLEHNTNLAASNRRLTAHLRQVALANEQLELRLEQDQQNRNRREPKPVPKSVLSWRIGNRL